MTESPENTGKTGQKNFFQAVFVALHRRKWYNGVMSSEAKMRAVERYNAKTYDRIYVRMKKADAEHLKAHLNGRSVNGFINDAIQEKLEREKQQ